MAKASAFKDPRFPPLRKDEYPLIDIEISVLSPIEPVMNISEIKVGRDGLIVSKGFNSGLLLPQVPVEQRWTSIHSLKIPVTSRPAGKCMAAERD